MRELLEEKLNRFNDLEKMLVDPEVLGNSNQLASVAREHGSLAKLATKYRRFKEVIEEIGETREMIEGDVADMRELAEAELPELTEEREKIWDELLELTIGGEDANRSRCIMEIRAGTGGDEAALFARDLYEMYKHHSEPKKWKVEILNPQSHGIGRIQRNYAGDHRRGRLPRIAI